MSQGPYLAHDPVSLTICADLSQHTDDYPIDAVWQLGIHPDEPITLKTSFGLRAQSFQIFPVFMVNKVGMRRIADFFSTPQIRQLWQDHIQLSFNPHAACLASYDLWVAAPDTLESRITLKNIGTAATELGARVASRLIAFGAQSGMNLSKRKAQNLLKGESDGLHIMLVMDGMHKPIISPELALENTKLLQPSESLSIFWRCKISEGSKPVDERVFSVFPVNWDAEMARLELAQQTREINITTPHVDWDIAFRMVQVQARLLLGRDGTDGDMLRAIQVRNINSVSNSDETVHALAIWQLVHTLLPARPDDASNLFESYLTALPQPDTGKGNSALAFPILCQTAWNIHSTLQDKAFLQRTYPGLRSRLFAWFWAQNDLDQDGLPEWFSLAQTGLVDLNSFDLINTDGLITPISTAESLGLAALLLKECHALKLMARVFEDSQTENVLEILQSKLQVRIKDMREANQSYRDRDSHLAHEAEVYFEGLAKDLPAKAITLKPASRLNLKIKPEIQLRKPGGLIIQGLNADGVSIEEEISPEDIIWLPGVFLYSSKSVFSRVDRLSGTLEHDTQLSLYSADLTKADLSHLLAWDPNKETPFLTTIMEQWLAEEHDNARFGLPEQLPLPKPEQIQANTNIAWNALLVQHVLSLGERDLAFRLFSELMFGAIVGLKQEHALHERFDSASGRPVGKANDIRGLVPISLFLDILGIKIYSPGKVSIGGTNPVPWPVTVRYMGLEITRDQKNSTIVMPDGTKHHHYGSAIKIFVMDNTEK